MSAAMFNALIGPMLLAGSLTIGAVVVLVDESLSFRDLARQVRGWFA